MSEVKSAILEQVGDEAGEIAVLASAAIRRALTPDEKGDIDSRTAKDLSGLVKDMISLHRELTGSGREITGRFLGETESAAE